MIAPAFVIFSPSRCGSTTLQRALSLIPGTWVAYEPGFYDHREEAVLAHIKDLLTDHSGFKHVFEPTGYPFRDVHRAVIEEMERDEPLWMKLNSTILNYPDLRIVFLCRRNGFDRVVSDQVDKNTNVEYANKVVSADEAVLYKEKMARLPLPAIDEILVRWYLTNLPRIQDQLRSSVTANDVIDVWYEDIFGPEVPLGRRIERFAKIVEFLQLPAPQKLFDSPELALLLRPAAKLNDAAIFGRIPNYKQLRERFNGHETSVADERDGSGGQAPGEEGKTSGDVSPAKMPEDPTIRPREFRLRAAGDNLARLDFPPDFPGAVRIAIAAAATGVSFDIQLNFLDWKVEANCLYQLSFRARADRARAVFVGVAQAHDPWMSLGLYEEIGLSTEWRDFEIGFRAPLGDEQARIHQARIHVDVGGSLISVEIARPCLAKQPDEC